MNRTVRSRSVAVPWSLFPREPSVDQVPFLSLLWRGHDCRTWTVVCASSPQGQRADFSMPIFFMWLRSLQWPVLSRNIMVCLWRDCKRWVSCWGLLPPLLCLKSVRLLLAKCNEMRRLGPNIYGLKSGPDLLSSILTCGTLPRRCWTISKINLSLTRK